MAHPQHILFDTFHTLDSSQASLMLSNNGPVYNNFHGNMQQYPNNTGSSYSPNWNLSGSSSPTGYPPSNQPRAVPPNPHQFIHHNIQSSTYPQHSFPSYIPSSPSYTLSEPHRLHTEFQSSHARVNSSHHHRPRSEENVVYSMLSPALSDVSNSLSLSNPSNSTRGGSRGGNAWEGTSPQGNSLQGLGTDVAPEVFGWSHHPADNQYYTFDPSWNEPISSSMSSPDIQLQLPLPSEQKYSVEIPSPQSRPTTTHTHRQRSPASTTSSSSSSSISRRNSSEISSTNGKVCSHCHATSTPLWRREPSTLKPLCNACGLYLQQRNKHRPKELIEADVDDSDESDGDTSGPECSHCHTHRTSVWRRSKTGAQLCNACGVYSRLRGRDRPLSLKRNKIKPRSKHTPPATSPR